MKKLVMLVYSLTGNTKYLCSYVSNALIAKGVVTSVEYVDLIDFCRGDKPAEEIFEHIQNADIIGIGWLAWKANESPSIRDLLFAAPKPVFAGKPAFLLCTAGGSVGKGFQNVTWELASKGCTVVDTLCVTAASSFIPMSQPKPKRYAWGMDKRKGIEPFIERLAPKLESFKWGTEPPAPASTRPPIANVNLSNFLGDFRIDKAKCIKCKKCVRQCPFKNISSSDDVEEGYPVFHNKCQGCCRCFHLCPKNAIIVTGAENRTQYEFNPAMLVDGPSSPTFPQAIGNLCRSMWTMFPKVRMVTYAVAATTTCAIVCYLVI